jgi:D-arabinose 1-dehydrogenase-like Zn-dependent alcohol dehydrogenase
MAPCLLAWARNADRSGPEFAGGGAIVVVVVASTGWPTGGIVVLGTGGAGTLAADVADDVLRTVVAVDVPSAPGRNATTV